MITVVIPALNEERAIAATLRSVLRQEGRPEVIVVDGGSEDRTTAIVAEIGTRHANLRLVEAGRGRARQMNAGAAVANGDWLLFLHADTLLPERALESIEAQPGTVVAGCFRQRFSTPSRVLAALSLMHNLRFRVTRVIYGDQAMFIRHAAFAELGGFPDHDMEDVAFGLRLRRVTTPVMLSHHVITGARKFDQMGHWRAVARSVSLLVRFRRGDDVSGDQFFDQYR
jgi:rSAM/selenodomain-associated transferase 2